jgi:hypothetical protein
MSKTATAEKAAISKAEFQTFEAIRACTADVLSRFQNIPLTRYDGCFIQQDTVSAQLREWIPENQAEYCRGRRPSTSVDKDPTLDLHQEWG